MSGAIDLFNQLAKNDFGFFQKINAVSDLMTPEPRVLTLDHKLCDALALFEDSDTHHAPVVSPEDGDVVGILSDRDVLRHRPYTLGTPAEKDDDHRALQIPISQIMTRDPFWVTPTAPPVEALHRMIDHHIDSVLVYEDRQDLLGIVTPGDLIKILMLYHHVCTRTSTLKRLRLVDLDLGSGVPVDEIFSRGAQTVRDVMTADVVRVRSDETVEKAIKLMQRHSIRHLPVMDAETDRLAGLLTDREILGRLDPSEPNAEKSDAVAPKFRDRLFATESKEFLRARVISIMQRDPPSIRPEALLSDALQQFQAEGMGGMPVLDEKQQVVGIVTTYDVLKICRVIMQLARMESSRSQADCEAAEPSEEPVVSAGT